MAPYAQGLHFRVAWQEKKVNNSCKPMPWLSLIQQPARFTKKYGAFYKPL
jgi:hypothetical protein